MPEMAGIRSTVIKEKNMITNYEATVVTTDDNCSRGESGRSALAT